MGGNEIGTYVLASAKENAILVCGHRERRKAQMWTSLIE